MKLDAVISCRIREENIGSAAKRAEGEADVVLLQICIDPSRDLGLFRSGKTAALAWRVDAMTAIINDLWHCQRRQQFRIECLFGTNQTELLSRSRNRGDVVPGQGGTPRR